VVEFGIACEACHGEGEWHVRRHSGVAKVTAEVDSVVNPKKMDKQASADVCGRCHSIVMEKFSTISKAEFHRDGNPQRPGQPLNACDFLHVVQATPDHRESEVFSVWSKQQILTESFWADGMVRVSGREYNGLIESACFLHGEMTCLSCHTMHPSGEQSLDQWRDDQLKPAMRGDQACLQCHGEYADRITQHTHHPADSSGSRCMNCHMPYTTYGLLKTIRSHQISSPTVTQVLETRRPDACTLCHLDRTIVWTTEHLRDWYGQRETKFTEQDDAATTSAAILHYLKGDAGQRAVLAGAFNWQAARDASGTKWMEPLLLIGCNDPYDAVRIISARALRSLPGKRTADFDPLAPANQRLSRFLTAAADLDANLRLNPRPEVLVSEDGVFDFLRARGLMQQRDDSPVHLRE
jgi:hypothetical protein